MRMWPGIYEILNLLTLAFLLCEVGGGMMEKQWEMMKSMMGWNREEKKIAIPIPIPVIVKEKPSYQPPPPPPQPQKAMKSKDWIWKLMLIKAMKDHDKGSKGCSSKMIMFPSKGKGDKGCCCPETTTAAPPEEDDYDYDPEEQRMMGWGTNNVPVFRHIEDILSARNHQPSHKLIPHVTTNNKKGDPEMAYGESEWRTVHHF